MSESKTLVEQFINQELDDKVRFALEGALRERALSDSVVFRELNFNCFDVVFDFKKGVVILQDVLSVESDSFIEVSISEFISICDLSGS